MLITFRVNEPWQSARAEDFPTHAHKPTLHMRVIKIFYRIRNPTFLNLSNGANSETSLKDPTMKLQI